MSSEILRFIDAIHMNKGIEKEFIYQGIEAALSTVARKTLDIEEYPEITIDRETGEIVIPEEYNIKAQDLGRIAAQTARHIIIQKIREAEKQAIVDNFKTKIGDIITGNVMGSDRGALIVNLGKIEAIMLKKDQVHGESFKRGNRIRALVYDVTKKSGKIHVYLSRAHVNFVKRLFELEVPEIAEGIVKIQAIVREPGFRTKIAVSSDNNKIDSVGACVGVRGARIRNIVEELFGEKVDIIAWKESKHELIANALKTAEIYSIEINEDSALVYVRKDQLPLAIGKNGQNVRLASKLTSMQLDIRCIDDEEDNEEEGSALNENNSETVAPDLTGNSEELNTEKVPDAPVKNEDENDVKKKLENESSEDSTSKNPVDESSASDELDNATEGDIK